MPFFHSVSPFEAIMLLCFGASWPFSVIKTWKTKTSTGRSFVFLWLVFIGYISGIINRVIHPDFVIVLYILNALMVFVDLMLCYRYRNRHPAGTAKTTVS